MPALRPRQIEFSRLNLTRTIMSKRYLRMLVEGGYVSGWDDPRMPTLCAMRRRGYTPESIRDFIDRIGVAKPTAPLIWLCWSTVCARTWAKRCLVPCRAPAPEGDPDQLARGQA